MIMRRLSRVVDDWALVAVTLAAHNSGPVTGTLRSLETKRIRIADSPGVLVGGCDIDGGQRGPLVDALASFSPRRRPGRSTLR